MGDWEGQANAFAIWTEGGWRFVQAFEGMQASEMLTGCPWRFTAGQWVRGELCAEAILVDGKKVLGGQLPAISAPSGGATIDVECRAQLTAVIAALRTHGLIAS
ncbi:hypothetical protein GCM10022280_07880 [Sphingomonas swuensis]|uniref:DUF2793 domain-containing protein n=2 Tax=Sphingomonas swuensis TaxID=977800 RepID=A0ABP7SIZ2_9SPHN